MFTLTYNRFSTQECIMITLFNHRVQNIWYFVFYRLNSLYEPFKFCRTRFRFSSLSVWFLCASGFWRPNHREHLQAAESTGRRAAPHVAGISCGFLKHTHREHLFCFLFFFNKMQVFVSSYLLLLHAFLISCLSLLEYKNVFPPALNKRMCPSYLGPFY